MNQSKKPFIINVGLLINQPIGYSRAVPFEFKEIELDDGFTLRDMMGTIDLIRTQDGLRAQAVFDALAQNECSRCLEIYANEIHSEFEEFFTFPYVDSSEDEIEVPENGNIDFLPIIHDYLLMESPIQPICQPNCRGLCAVCGENLNHGTCEHFPPSGSEKIMEDDAQGEHKKTRSSTGTRTN